MQTTCGSTRFDHEPDFAGPIVLVRDGCELEVPLRDLRLFLEHYAYCRHGQAVGRRVADLLTTGREG